MLVGTKEALISQFESVMENEYDVHTCDYSVPVIKRYLKMIQPKIAVCFKPVTSGIDTLAEIEQEFPNVDFIAVLESEDTSFVYALNHRVKIARKPMKVKTLKKLLDEYFDTEKEEKKSILAVDDSGMELRNLRSILKDRYDLTFATSGNEALGLLEEKRFDLILLDYEMPMMSGSEFFKKVQKNDKMKDIPVVFLTGVSEKDRIMKVAVEHPAGYLLKPINSDLLLSTIKNILGK